MSLYGSFEIGKKALTASQLGQSTTGHNIANVDTEGFSRQEVTQAASQPTAAGKGTGVDVTGVRRVHDGFTKQKIVDTQTHVGTWQARLNILAETEVLYTDLEGSRLRGSMDEFWGAWSSVANEPESGVLRRALVTKADELTEDCRMFNDRLTQFNDLLNARITSELLEINQITGEIALLNKQVEQLESRGLPANDARDKRELLLQNLSAKIDVRYFESPRGTMEIQLVNGQNLVNGRNSYELNPLKTAEGNGNVGIGLMASPGVETDITDMLSHGSLKELINQRDGNISTYRNDLNVLVMELAFRVNQIHNSGTGLNGVKQEETSTYELTPDLAAMPLPFLRSGSFEIKLLNQNKEVEEVITVDLQAGVDTQGSIVEKINRAAGAYETNEEGVEVLKDVAKFKARLNENGTITLSSGQGKQFIYGKDNTNLMTILGLNCFFHLNYGAGDFRVNPELLEDEMKIAAGTNLLPGDNSVALEIAELQFKTTMNDETISFDEFYNSQITDIGLKVQNAQKGLASNEEMLEQYEALRNSLSSVNLDEEMTKMIKFQRAYESSAKFLSTIDQMTQSVINM